MMPNGAMMPGYPYMPGYPTGPGNGMLPGYAPPCNKRYLHDELDQVNAVDAFSVDVPSGQYVTDDSVTDSLTTYF
jgi:hypothetical protein